MDNKEKEIRCCNTEVRKNKIGQITMCRVYTRWVQTCADCSFW